MGGQKPIFMTLVEVMDKHNEGVELRRWCGKSYGKNHGNKN